MGDSRLRVVWKVLTHGSLRQSKVDDLNNRARDFLLATFAAFISFVALPESIIPSKQLILTPLGSAVFLFLAAYFFSERTQRLGVYYCAGTFYLAAFALMVLSATQLAAEFLAGMPLLGIYVVASTIIVGLVWNKSRSMWNLYKVVKQTEEYGRRPVRRDE
ncbi:hypothetical protein [Natrinema sp. 1APR25-10V2]|uniref:hypothetical protein n=1 Tax=Natrinema sp. 1APR25-10V2 TaxID=2951081 RepID=UPI0028771486|nr:hypothetical protein [Natrinema sp. 1APR25-10V2]MDS0476845.1 hypothetical protein [Natrinema sp. 1APR25-10V2]